MSLKISSLVAAVALGGIPGAGALATSHDGKLFDPGVTMTERASGAPEQLEKLAFLVGSWDVTYTTFDAEGAAHEASGQADVTYMNRGHGFMERFRTDDFDGKGHERSSVTFLTYVHASRVWNLGEADSFSESVALFHGDFRGDSLVVKNAVRRLGGQNVIIYRRTLRRTAEGAALEEEQSTDFGTTWKRSLAKTYTTRPESADLLAVGDGLGTAAPDLPAEARQFDFLLGEKDAFQDITLPTGENYKFPSLTTAVRTMNGHAILEFNWYDTDPNLPDAATSIIRIYNRAMRRWESLYVTNRFNGQLFFGGVKEGDDLVLTLFEANRADAPFSRFVFHDIREEGYRWYAERTNDHGATFAKTWLIDVTQRTEGATTGR